MRLILSNKWNWVLLIIVLSTCVFGMDVSVVEGVKSGGVVTQDFGKAVLTVSPETASSITNKFEQTITLKNTYSQSLYFWIDPYFENKDLSNIQLYEIVPFEDTFEETTCPEEHSNPKDCVTKTVSFTNYKDVIVKNLEATSWGGAKHNFNEQGIILGVGESKSYKIKYTTNTPSGKWNARVWADYQSDWYCVLDAYQDCVFDYTIDPSYTLLQGFSNGYKLDNVTDVNQTHNLTNGGSTTFTTGKVGNGANFSSTAKCLYRSGSWFTKAEHQGDWTVSSWILFSSVSNTTNRDPWSIFSSTAGSGLNTVLYYTGGGATKSFQVAIYDGTANFYNTGLKPVANNWYHVVVSKNSSSWKVWINDVNLLNFTRAVIATSTSNDYSAVGCYYAGSILEPVAEGMVDSVYVWKQAISSDEVSVLYNAGAGVENPFTAPPSADNYSVTLENTTYVAVMNETANYNFNVNYSWGWNVTNVSNVSLNIYGNIYPASLDVNGTNWSRWAARDVRPPLTITNNTAYQFNWTYNALYDNSTTIYNSSSNYTTYTTWSYYSTGLSNIPGNHTETETTNWNSTFAKNGNETNVTLTYWTRFNNTDIQGTTITNTTNYYLANFTVTMPFVNTTWQNFPLYPYLNVTFNGTTLTRNITGQNQTTNVHQMILSNCSQSNATNTTIQYYIRDISDNTLITSANTVRDYTIYITNSSLYRNYTVISASNSSPKTCVYPSGNFAPMFNINSSSYVTASGYLSNTFTFNDYTNALNVSNHTLYLSNSSTVQNVIVTLTDQNDNKLLNYPIRVYLWDNTSYSLIDTEITNLQGQVQYNLYVTDTQYQFRVYHPNLTFAKSFPDTGGMSIVSTSFTLKIDLAPQVTIGNVVEMLGINHSLTFNNGTGIINLTFNDANNLSSYNCLRVFNWTMSNGSIIGNNCTANHNDTLYFYLGNSNGTFVAQYIAVRSEDSLNYLVDSIVINRNVYQDFQREGIFWSFLLIGTVGAIGLYINPILGIVFINFATIAAYWIGILPIGWLALSSIIAGSLIVAFLLRRE